jgi:hypothetical protein
MNEFLHRHFRRSALVYLKWFWNTLQWMGLAEVRNGKICKNYGILRVYGRDKADLNNIQPLGYYLTESNEYGK